ncbi:MAG: ATP-binding protein, partial [Rhodospirillales bacterium]|nr:ATP-binding protein [Rhodospirillales bacterium]
MQSISESDLVQRLEFDNPWWAFTDDTQISFRVASRRSFFTTFRNQVEDLEKGQVLALAGPLRAGKTVLMRQVVASLIESGVSSQAVFYCALTTPSYTAVSLAALFEMFCRHHQHPEGGVMYVFYDEAQYVRGWEDELLALAKRFPNVRFVTAVSAGAPSLVSEALSHDGRMKTFILPPLTFPEFLQYRETEEQLFDLDKTAEGGNVALKSGAISNLNAEFHRYVNFGGFLEGVLGQKREGAPAPTFIRDGVADRVLHKDLAGMHGVNDVQELNRLFGLLAYNTGLEVSMDDLARTANIAKNTVRKYLDYLESAFLIRRVARLDRDAKRFQRAVAFKVYLTSPCLYSALFGPVAPND